MREAGRREVLEGGRVGEMVGWEKRQGRGGEGLVERIGRGGMFASIASAG